MIVLIKFPEEKPEWMKWKNIRSYTRDKSIQESWKPKVGDWYLRKKLSNQGHFKVEKINYIEDYLKHPSDIYIPNPKNK